MKMIKNLNHLTSAGVSMLISIGFLFSLSTSLMAQIPSTPEAESSDGITVEGDDDLTPVIVWTCSQGDKQIKVDAKDYSGWQETIEGSGWQCSEPEQIPSDVSGEIKFSCEPQDGTLGILVVTWLQGEGGKEQMQAWMEELGSKPAQVCRTSKVEPWDIK